MVIVHPTVKSSETKIRYFEIPSVPNLCMNAHRLSPITEESSQRNVQSCYYIKCFIILNVELTVFTNLFLKKSKALFVVSGEESFA